MGSIDFVDTTFRDAQQSLWGEQMNTAMMHAIAPSMDRAGFKAIDAISISNMEFAVRHHKEDPWERIRILSNVITNTTLSIMMPGRTITIFKLTPGALYSLFMERLAANGIRRVQLGTSRGDVSESVAYARSSGLEVIVALNYCLSPVHTDEHYEMKVRDMVKLSPDGVYLKDPGGLLTPDRVRTLIPAIQRNLDGLPLEIHSHCTTGLAPLCYLEAMKLGVKTFHTATSPLANGPSQPSIENILKNARSLGYSASLDEDALGRIATHFREVARTEGWPEGAPLEYDLAQYEHQIPGGVISNLRRQLLEMGIGDRLEEVLREAVVVRRELGYPIMITPFSQFVVTQATLNVIQGERYTTISDEVIQFALGHYGKQEFPMDQNVVDIIMSHPRTKEFVDWKPEEISIEALRQYFGSGYTDDDLLLLVLCKEEDLQTMRRAGPIRTEYLYGSVDQPGRSFVKELMLRSDLSYIRIDDGNLTISLDKRGRGAQQTPAIEQSLASQKPFEESHIVCNRKENYKC